MSELPPQPGYETVHQYEPGPPNLPPPKKGMSPWIIVLLVIGGMCVLGIPILAAILFPVFAQAKLAANKSATLSNMKMASLGVIMYTSDFDDCHPIANTWQESTVPYTKNSDVYSTKGQEASPNMPYVFAFAEPLSMMPSTIVEAPSNTILLFESTSTGANTYGGPELLPERGYHGDMCVFARVEGSVKAAKRAEFENAKTVGNWDHFPVKEGDSPENWIIR